MKTLKKFAGLMLAVLMVIMAAMPATAAVDDTGFVDVSPGDWFAEAVTYCRDNGLMAGKGNGRFAPNDNMTRAELVTVLYRAAGEPAVTNSNPFTDITSGQWYTNGVLWAQQNEIVSGYGNGRFGTNDPVRREQIATILWRDAGSPTVGKDAEFADANLISSFALEAVDWARANGIVSGKGNNRFDPQGSATRAEVATMLMNYSKLDQDTPTPPSDGPKVLIAYFSATNTTEGVAQRLAAGLGADLHEITPAAPYTSADLNYGDSSSRTPIEMNDPSARPAISGSVENIEQYDVVFIGYPIWWGQAPKIISTFLESYEWGGKTIVPFCTSGSSGIGSSGTNLESLTSGAEWLPGRRFSGGASQDELLAWADSLHIDLN